MNTITIRLGSSLLCLLALAVSSAACASPTDERDDTSSGSQESAVVAAPEPLDAIVENMPTPADEPAVSASTSYKWLGATNGATFQAFPYSGHLRVAVRVRSDNGIVTSYRGYGAILCFKAYSAYPNEAWPCSVRDGLLIDVNSTVAFATSNTGTDGYYSAYTAAMSPLTDGWEARTVLRNNPKLSSSIVVGLGGHTFHPGDVLTPAVDVYR